MHASFSLAETSLNQLVVFESADSITQVVFRLPRAALVMVLVLVPTPVTMGTRVLASEQLVFIQCWFHE